MQTIKDHYYEGERILYGLKDAETNAIIVMVAMLRIKRILAIRLNSGLKKLKTEKFPCTGKVIWLKVSDVKINLP